VSCAEVAEQAAWPENHLARRELTQASSFSVLSGACSTNSDGSCVYSDHWSSGSVQNNQHCSIYVNNNVDLTAPTWSTEACCDKLQIGSTYYSGGSSPAGVSVTAGSVMYWRTDHSVTYRGWEVCGDPSLPAHPTGVANAFSVSSGSCRTNSDGSCFYSPHYPGYYGNSQTCSITVGANTLLDPQAFNTESGYDWLTVNGVQYQGTTGPTGVLVTAGSTISWRTDGSVTRTGFAICSGTPATPSPTTVSPTATPTTMHPTTMHPTSMHPTTISPTTMHPTTISPSASPSAAPTATPTAGPTQTPSMSPSVSPTMHPTSAAPTLSPSMSPSLSPSASPSASPTKPLVEIDLVNGTFTEDVDLSQVLSGMAPLEENEHAFSTQSVAHVEDVNATSNSLEEIWNVGSTSVGPMPSLFLFVCTVGLAVTAMVTLKRRRAASASRYAHPLPLHRYSARTTA
jgi:hypothetical protein